MPTPPSLWPPSPPPRPSLFSRGGKCEGVDPLHQSLFCVLSVEDVVGARIKLHFDGWVLFIFKKKIIEVKKPLFDR